MQRDDKMDENLEIWDALEGTDPKFTREFKAGGFKGTSVNVSYNTRRITELFGPCGGEWGFRVKDERVDCFISGVDKDPRVYVHVCTVQMWFRKKGEPEERIIEAFGTTKMAYESSKGGYIVDAEAPKKSLTDAMSKLMLMLGASADVWFGWYDDKAYVAQMREEFAINHEDDDGQDDDRGSNRDRDDGRDGGDYYDRRPPDQRGARDDGRRNDDRDDGRRDDRRDSSAVNELRTGSREGGMYDDGNGDSAAPSQRREHGENTRRSVDPDTNAGPSEPDARPIRLIDPSGANKASVFAYDKAAGIIEKWCADPKVTAVMIRAMINCNKDELLRIPGLVAVMDEMDRKKRVPA